MIYEKENGNVGIGIENPPARLSVKGASFEIQGVTATAGSDEVTGNGTLFTVQVAVGDQITIGGETRIVTEITNQTHLKVDSNFITTTRPPDDVMTVHPDILRVEDSTGEPKLVVSKKGNIGMGTDNPRTSLHIPEQGLQIGTSNQAYNNFHIVSDMNGGSRGFRLFNGNYGDGTHLLTVKVNGYVGIGKTSPQDKLDMGSGSIRFYSGIDYQRIFANSWGLNVFTNKLASSGLRVGEIYGGLGLYAGDGSTDYNLGLVAGKGKGVGIAGDAKNPFTGNGLFVASNDRVGIGTTVPGYPLEVSRKDNTRARIAIYSAGDVPNDLFFGSNGQKNRWSISSRESTDGNGYPLTIWRNNGGWSRVMSIDYANGNVGIGTSVLGAKLNVNGNLKLQCGVAINEFSSDGTLSDKSDSAVPTEKAVKSYVDKIQSGRVSIGRTKTFGERKIKRKISYRKFSKSPTVVLGVVGLDVNKRFNTRYKIWVENVTDNGCDVIFRTWSDTDIYLLEAQWIAYGPM